MALDGLGQLGHMGREQGLRRHAAEGEPAGQHLVGEHPGSVEVGAVIEMGVARRLLRSHVRGRAEGQAQ